MSTISRKIEFSYSSPVNETKWLVKCELPIVGPAINIFFIFIIIIVIILLLLLLYYYYFD